jgi:aminocarboxymuconate-semialdehyde decarboxylase
MGAERLRSMNEQGIDIAALGINPYWYSGGDAQAHIRCRTRSSRSCAPGSPILVAFATIAATSDLAVTQLEDGVKSWAARRSVGSNVDGVELADPKFHPVWARRKSRPDLHPSGADAGARQAARRHGELTNTISFRSTRSRRT